MSLITDTMLGLYTYENVAETEWPNQLENKRSSISLTNVTLNEGVVFYNGNGSSEATLTIPEDITAEAGLTIYMAFNKIEPDEISGGYAQTTILRTDGTQSLFHDVLLFDAIHTPADSDGGFNIRMRVGSGSYLTFASFNKKYSNEPFIAAVRFFKDSTYCDIISEREGEVFSRSHPLKLFTNIIHLFGASIVPTKAFGIFVYRGAHTTEQVKENMVYIYNQYFPKFINHHPEYDIYLRGVTEPGRDFLVGPTPKFCFRVNPEEFGDRPVTGYMKLNDTDILTGPISKFAWRTDIFYNEGNPFTGYMRPRMSTIDFEPDKTREQYINLLDRIRVYSPPHGLDRDFPVLEMEIPLNKPEETKLHLGTKNSISLTNINASINEDLKNRISNLPKPSTILKAAQENATALIRAGTEGYVTLVKEDGATKELVISDRPDYTEEGARIWRWNINGLGFSANGYNGNYNTAITMDGAIVANMITTGEMFADRIKGGTLTLGGFDNQYGLGRVVNSDGTMEMQFRDGLLEFYRDGVLYSQLKLNQWFYEGTPAVTVSGNEGCGFVIDTGWVGVRASDGSVYSTISNDIKEINYVADCYLDENGEIQKTMGTMYFCNGIMVTQ